MDVFCDNEAYKLNYKISKVGTLTINVQCGILSSSFQINNPKKINIDTWKKIRHSKNRYNLMIIFDEDYKIGYHQYIKCFDGILEMGIIYGHNIEGKMYSSIIKIPIEYCFNILDKIIIELSPKENTMENTIENTMENTMENYN
jgi:hypothetical protein